MGRMTDDDKPNGADNRVDFLVHEIGLSIAAEKYKPGETLPIEQELCDRFNAGRNAVREAIKMLTAKGFVRTERRAGTIVQPRDQWAMLDPQVLSWMLGNPDLRQSLLRHMSQLRRIIEPEAAALAAENGTIVEILRLFEAYEQMNQSRHSRELAISADIRFHQHLLSASHNPLIASMSRSIDVLLRANFEISIESPNGYIRNLEQHGKVAEAIHQRNPAAARKEMLKLLANNDSDLARMLEAPVEGSRKGGGRRSRSGKL